MAALTWLWLLQRQKYPKVGHSTNIQLEDAENIRNNLAFAGRGIRWGCSTSDSVPRDRGWEKNQGWKQPPKTSFPCDLNDNCSCPASWLDWETSFSPCYPIIQMTHVYLKWSLLYISCQPRYTFNSKEGINWQRCKKDVFAVPVSVKVSLRRKNYASLDTNVSGQCPLLLAKLCFQAATIFTFAVQFLSVYWSFILHSLPQKNHPRTVIYETLLPEDKYL